MTRYGCAKRLGSLLLSSVLVVSSTAGWAQAPAVAPAPAASQTEDATEVSSVTVVGKRMPPAEAPKSRTCETYVQNDPAFREQLMIASKLGSAVMGPPVYQPTRLPRNPDYNAPPSTAPGSPIIAANPIWNPKDLTSVLGPDASGMTNGEVAAVTNMTDVGADSGLASSDTGYGFLAGQPNASSATLVTGDTDINTSIEQAVSACRQLYTRGGGSSVGVAGRSTIAGNDKTLPTAFSLFDEGRYEESLGYFQKAHEKLSDAEGGDEARLMLGKLHMFAPIPSADPNEGLEWLKKAALSPFDPTQHLPIFDPKEPNRNTATGEAAVILGNIYLSGFNGVSKDLQQARRWFLRANHVGHVPAAKTLGDMYYYGHGVPRDIKQAARYYKQAATLDYVPAQYALAELLYRGELGARDLMGALAWYNAAAKYDHPGALYALALAYDTGEGVSADSQKAIAFYKEAALKGNIPAQSAVGTYFYEGKVIAKDDVTARKWFETAAAQGDPDAMFNLAVMMMKGEGGSLDRTKAWVWFRIAQARGLPKAQDALAVLEQRMTSDERKSARELFAPERQS